MSIPFTVQIGPFTYYGLVVITGVSTLSMSIISLVMKRKLISEVTNVIFCIQLLHAPLHSLLIIATTPSYREAILRFVMIKKNEFSTPIFSISPRRSEFTGSKTVQSVAISTVTVSSRCLAIRSLLFSGVLTARKCFVLREVEHGVCHLK